MRNKHNPLVYITLIFNIKIITFDSSFVRNGF